MAACVAVSAVGVSAPVGFGQSPMERALATVPDDAAGFVVVPNVSGLSADLEQCIDRMGRPGTEVLGRPIDQVSARLGISSGLEEKGPFLAWWPRSAEGSSAPRVLVSVSNVQDFLSGNFDPRPEVAPDAYEGPDDRIWFARDLGNRVLLSTDAEAVRGHAASGEFGKRFLASLPEAWRGRMLEADLVAWGGPAAIEDLTREGANAMPDEVVNAPGFDAAAAERWREAFESSLESGIVAVDVDPLGVALRSFAILRPDSPLGELVAKATPGRASFDRLPGQPFYLAGSMDLSALGGAEPLRAFAALAGVPSGGWLDVAENLQRAQLAVYPSRLGIAAGGFFNDSSLAIEASDAAALRSSIEQGVARARGDAAGLRWSGTYERDRALRKGGDADAFEVGQTAIPAGEAGAAGVSDLAQRQLAWQVAFGSRGLNGFFETVDDGWSVLTFSQRPDVLARAIGAARSEGRRLDQDGAIRAMRSWLPENSQAIGFVGVGQFGRLIKQLARMIPGADGASLPVIDTNVEPIGFGLEIGDSRFESAVVIPSGVLGIVYDAILDSMLSGTGRGAEDPNAGASDDQR